MSPPRALITGVTGQDGAYLARYLLGKGYEVHGIKRRSSSFNTGRIEDIYEDPHDRDARPVLATVAPGTGIHDEVTGSGAGLCTEPGNVGALREALDFAIDNPEWRISSGAAARDRAVRRWGRDALLANFVDYGKTLAERACPLMLAA